VQAGARALSHCAFQAPPSPLAHRDAVGDPGADGLDGGAGGVLDHKLDCAEEGRGPGAEGGRQGWGRGLDAQHNDR
jgi:hypothetical protein